MALLKFFVEFSKAQEKQVMCFGNRIAALQNISKIDQELY